MIKIIQKALVVFGIIFCLSLLACSKSARIPSVIPQSCIECAKEVSKETLKLVCKYLAQHVPILNCDKLLKDLNLIPTNDQ